MLITFELNSIFCSNSAYVCGQHFLTTGMCNCIFMDKALLSIGPAGRGQLSKMLITLVPNGIFG